MMKLDLVLSGVGGQGILSIAYLVDAAAIRRGYHVKQAEVHGMSQRGGAVYSHLRLGSNPVLSDLIPEGMADMILSMEPLEVGRYLNFLGPTGMIVTNSAPFVNIPNYPDEQTVRNALFEMNNVIMVDAKAIATKAGVPLAQNVALLGVALPFLPFEASDLVPVIQELFGRKGEKVVAANLKALDCGLRIGLFYRELLQRNVKSAHAFALMSRFDPTTVEPSLAVAFADFARDNSAKFADLLAKLPQEVACSRETLTQMMG
jgi:indolepyruvate ferredoxin oxidoreductase beta subunit